MIHTEQNFDDPIVQDTGELKITEYIEPVRKIIIESPKRSEKFQIIRGSPQSHFFKILYESGKSIPELEGMFTSPAFALKELKYYLDTVKPTKEARYKERWGDQEIPVLKTKKVRKSAFSSTDNPDSN